MAPWLSLQVYALANASVTAVARSVWGGARSARYGSLSALFWIGLVVTVLILLRYRSDAGRKPTSAFVRRTTMTLALLMVAAYCAWPAGAVPVPPTG